MTLRLPWGSPGNELSETLGLAVVNEPKFGFLYNWWDFLLLAGITPLHKRHTRLTLGSWLSQKTVGEPQHPSELAVTPTGKVALTLAL